MRSKRPPLARRTTSDGPAFYWWLTAAVAAVTVLNLVFLADAWSALTVPSFLGP